MNEKKEFVENRSKEFAVRIVKLYKYLTEQQSEYVMAKQILRAGTSIGANVTEAEYAQSKPDFYSKLGIALKESVETRYWLELLSRTGYISEEQYQCMLEDVEAIIRILVKTTKNSKKV